MTITGRRIPLFSPLAPVGMGTPVNSRDEERFTFTRP